MIIELALTVCIPRHKLYTAGIQYKEQKIELSLFKGTLTFPKI